MDVMDGPKDEFYPIETYLCLKMPQSNGSVMIRDVIVDQPQIGPFKSIKELN